MSTSAIASTSPSYLPNSQPNAFQQNFQTLSQAIQSGNLSAAQQAYASLTQNASAQGQSGPAGGQANPVQQALASIGSALQSGDITNAQSTLQSMQQATKGHHGHHRHNASQAQNGGNNSPTQTSTGIAALSPATNSLVDIST